MSSLVGLRGALETASSGSRLVSTTNLRVAVLQELEVTVQLQPGRAPQERAEVEYCRLG